MEGRLEASFNEILISSGNIFESLGAASENELAHTRLIGKLNEGMRNFDKILDEFESNFQDLNFLLRQLKVNIQLEQKQREQSFTYEKKTTLEDLGIDMPNIGDDFFNLEETSFDLKQLQSPTSILKDEHRMSPLQLLHSSNTPNPGDILSTINYEPKNENTYQGAYQGVFSGAPPESALLKGVVKEEEFEEALAEVPPVAENGGKEDYMNFFIEEEMLE